MPQSKLQNHGFDLARLARTFASGDWTDPFSLLGPHQNGSGTEVRTFQPGARRVEAIDTEGRSLTELQPVLSDAGLWSGTLPKQTDYRLRVQWEQYTQVIHDPYAFDPLLGDMDLHLLGEGRHYGLNRCLGAHVMAINGVAGVRFAVWAPNAKRVSVVGDFNHWDGRRHMMRPRGGSGIWELFVPELTAGTPYKYEILGPYGLLPLKADPVAWQAELPPATASIVADPQPYEWGDQQWMNERAARHSEQVPMTVYELHVLSWRRWLEQHNRSLTWTELADQLIPYIEQMGFTHIELLPITAHPFNGSWGYQPTGLFAPMAESGSPAELAHFVDRCHRAGIGVIIDWVPAHFPTDPHGLARFDGTALYEYEDSREGFHQDWNTLIYNFGRYEVHNFLLASALHWLEVYHIDGLRVDAVASMLYRDYSRQEGEWIPNRHGGRENLEAIDFLRHLNTVVAERFPGTLVIAEESTAWPGVSHPVAEGGLGFSYKWNMGWMHDTLKYMQQDPIHRFYHHDNINFGLYYAFSERYVLPLSHDEVVHGKGSMLGKMPGDEWQQFANLRAYYGFMWGHPGKKLLFMGGEIAQRPEWNHDAQIDWPVLDRPLHAGVQRLVADLNHLYRSHPALHSADTEPAGFTWLVGDDHINSVYAFFRSGTRNATKADHPPVVVVCNFTPVPRHAYRIGVPRDGYWREAINTDAAIYGGSDLGNGGGVHTEKCASHGQHYSLQLTLPPLATLFLVYEAADKPTHKEHDT